jgi:hypothetical protein
MNDFDEIMTEFETTMAEFEDNYAAYEAEMDAFDRLMGTTGTVDEELAVSQGQGSAVTPTSAD